MYKSFTARNYRCFADLTVEPLERINLIVGKNGTGKTALLEALWLHHGYYNPELGLRVDTFRGLELFKGDEFLWDLFSEFDPERTIELSSRASDDRSRSLRITIRESPTSSVSLRNETKERENRKGLPTIEAIGQESTQLIKSEVLFDYTDTSGQTAQARAFVEQDRIRVERPSGIKEPSGIFLATRRRENPEVLAEHFSDLAVDRQQEKVVNILKIVEPRLKDLTVLIRGGGPMIYGDIGKKQLMPLPLMGDGLGRLLSIALAVPVAQNGILLIDESENGLYYMTISEVWKVIAGLAREYNVQIFATTHSQECVRAAHRAFEEDGQYDFRLHRLEWVKGVIRAVTYDQETLGAALEVGLEVR